MSMILDTPSHENESLKSAIVDTNFESLAFLQNEQFKLHDFLSNIANLFQLTLLQFALFLDKANLILS